MHGAFHVDVVNVSICLVVSPLVSNTIHFASLFRVLSVAARDRHVSARGASRSLVGMPWTRTTSQRPPGIMGHRLVGTRFLKGTSSQKSVEGEEIAAARVAVAKWKELNLKRAEEGDMMGAADADIKMYEAKAELARLQGDPVAEQEAKIAI